MKLLSGIAAATLASVVALASANAADMYSGPAGGGYKDGPAYFGVNWSGVYFGASVGGAWSQVDVHDFDIGKDRFSNSDANVFGGGQLGYNFQRGNFVFGAEADFGGMALNNLKASPVSSSIISQAESGLYADVTGRLGYALGLALVYAKGGYAYYDGRLLVTDVGVGQASVTGLSGWTVGGGLEYKIRPAWSVKAEYQYFDFGSESLVLPVNHDRFDSQLTVNTAKVGLNYFLGSVYEPLK
jgi:outer membrane immunogenic protein